ncbi:MAG: Maf family protein [Lachnospiraceae bacterium]|nr:Maf family protein [Lachnospiraceae bacterium]
MEEIVLASASPRRRELLTQIGIVHRVVPSLKEEVIQGSCPIEIVQNLARQKAEDVASNLQIPGRLVLGADTVVVFEDQILGKPLDDEEAFRMLSSLQGNTHQVYTGVAFCVWQEVTAGAELSGKAEDMAAGAWVSGKAEDTAAEVWVSGKEEDTPAVSLAEGKAGKLVTHIFYEETKVEVYPMTEEEIRAYLKTGDGKDKAGSYGIQGPFGAYIKGIQGDYYNVVGLPIGRVYQELKGFARYSEQAKRSVE